jgi:ABC-type uncharacterized transport system substrate-binding protein
LRTKRAIVGLVFAGLAASTGEAAAHPHVFAKARVEIVGAPDGKLAAVRNVWRMDELFSSTVLLEFDKNADAAFDDDELDEVGRTIKASIADYAYYTSVTTNGRAVQLSPPDAIHVLFDEGQLLLFFEMPAAEPVDLTTQTLTVANFDTSFYVAFDTDAKSFTLVDLPTSCRTTYVRPDEDAAARQWLKKMEALGPDEAAPSDGVDYSQILAARMEIACDRGANIKSR